MKSILLLTALLSCYLTSFSQSEFQLHIGTANYVGELFFKQSKLPEYDLKNARLAIGVGYQYQVFRKLNIRATLMYGKISGDDKRLGNNLARNLNFTSSIWDLTLAPQYHLLDPDRYLLSPYIFGGISVFHFNPYTTDRSGNKVYLQPLSTEGQGFVEGRSPYKLTQIAIPYGGGIKMQLGENLGIGVELSLRKTFTDYIDDVSTTYVDRNLLLQHRGQTAVDMAYRGSEVNTHTDYPAADTQRGISDFKDKYYFTTLYLSFGLGGFSGKDLSCPRKF